MKTFLAVMLSLSLATPALAWGGGYSEPEPEPDPPAADPPAPDPAPSAEPADGGETRLVDQEGVTTEDGEDVVEFLKKGVNTLVRVGTSPTCLIEQFLTFGGSAETCIILEVFDTADE